MTTLYMLVGLPGTGKSTWTNRFKRKHISELNEQSFKTNTPFQYNLSVISTDDIIQLIADQHRLTYNQIFDNLTYSFAEKLSHKLARFAFERNDVVIWDQTNLSYKSRGKKLEMVPKTYKKTAVSFGIPVDWKERLESRQGKVIPSDVLNGMMRGYDPPMLSEGFDDIINVN